MGHATRRMMVFATVASTVIAAWSCGGDSPTQAREVFILPAGALTPSARSAITLRDTVQYLSTSATLTNNGKWPAHLEYGACPVRVVAYRDESRTGQPVWNSDHRKPYHASWSYGCTLQLILQNVQPGHSLELTFSSPLIELVGDSLPNGRYYLSADVLTSDSPFTRVPAGSVDVALSR
jgi:hypothetical protein